mmetsp:Transcript_24212/g.76168  ORF Transcript_24212/g.76168 Transcript_24212/m.76168 type:complete len:457 (-) Transcript_24212:168-1538(-)
MHRRHRLGHHLHERVVRGQVGGVARHAPPAVLLQQVERAVEQVADVVGEVCVDHVEEALLAEVPVPPELDLLEEEVPNRVSAVRVHERLGVDDVAQGLAHLHPVLGEEAVPVDSPGEGQAGGHEHPRPVHCVEAEDVLADHVHRGGPPARGGVLQGGLLALGDERGEVPEESVEPHVDGLRGVGGHRNPPLHRRARDAEVPHAVLHPPQHLVAAVARAHKVGIVLEELLDLGLVVGELEEEVILLAEVALLLVDGAEVALEQVSVDLVLLAPHAVEPLVLGAVDVALVHHALEELQDEFLVLGLCGANVAVVLDVQLGPERLVQVLHAIAVLLGGLAIALRSLGDLLPVLVGPGDECDLLAIKPLEARNRIRSDGGVRAAHVRRSIDVEKRRGDVEVVLVRIVIVAGVGLGLASAAAHTQGDDRPPVRGALGHESRRHRPARTVEQRRAGGEPIER